MCPLYQGNLYLTIQSPKVEKELLAWWNNSHKRSSKQENPLLCELTGLHTFNYLTKKKGIEESRN